MKTTSGIKNALDGINNGSDIAEEKNNEPEDLIIGTILKEIQEETQ